MSSKFRGRCKIDLVPLNVHWMLKGRGGTVGVKGKNSNIVEKQVCKAVKISKLTADQVQQMFYNTVEIPRLCDY